MKRKDIATPATPTQPSLPSEPDLVKPGYETSEFWITLVATIVPNLITLLTIFKVVPNEIASTLSTALVAVIGGIITIIVAIRYIQSRTEVKMKYLDLQSHEKYYKRDVERDKADVEKNKAQLYLQLLQNGIIDKEKFKKEFNV